MRPTVILRSNPPQYENFTKVPFKPFGQFKLRNRLANTGKWDEDRPCVQEIVLLLQCFKDHDYNETRCADYISKFQKCFKDHKAQEGTQKAEPGAKTKQPVKRRPGMLPYDVAKSLLAKFPSE